MRRSWVRFGYGHIEWLEHIMEIAEEVENLQGIITDEANELARETGVTPQRIKKIVLACKRIKEQQELDASDTSILDIKSIIFNHLKVEFPTGNIEHEKKNQTTDNATNEAENAADLLAEEHKLFVESFNQGKICRFGNMSFVAPSSVYKPTEGSSTKILWQAIIKLMKINMPMIESQYKTTQYFDKDPHPAFSILEIGAGSGAVSIGLKERFHWAEVTASDISPRACATIECNALLHHKNIRIVEGDVWEPFTHEDENEMFDCVLFNLPLLDKPLEDQNELALCDPDGKLLHQFLMGLPEHVKPNGFAVFLHANFSAPLPMLPGKFTVVCEAKRTADTVFRALSWRL